MKEKKKRKKRLSSSVMNGEKKVRDFFAQTFGVAVTLYARLFFAYHIYTYITAQGVIGVVAFSLSHSSSRFFPLWLTVSVLVRRIKRFDAKFLCPAGNFHEGLPQCEDFASRFFFPPLYEKQRK